MRYLMLYRRGDDSAAAPTLAETAAARTLVDEMARAGVLIETDGLLAQARGARVRMDGGDFVVTDGAWADADGRVAGYAIVDVRSHEQAVDLAKRLLALMGSGESELRRMHDAPRPFPLERAPSATAIRGPLLSMPG